jgi:hypothetical protein
MTGRQGAEQIFPNSQLPTPNSQTPKTRISASTAGRHRRGWQLVVGSWASGHWSLSVKFTVTVTITGTAAPLTNVGSNSHWVTASSAA